MSTLWASSAGAAGVIENLSPYILHNLLNDLNEHNTFNNQRKDELQQVLTNVTLFLSRAKTRLRGYILLKSLLDSKVLRGSILIDNCQKWLQFALNGLKSTAVPIQEKCLAYLVIRDLLEYSSKIHELDRSIVNSSILDLINILDKSEQQSLQPALTCLYTILLRYPKATGSLKSTVEKLLIKCLDIQDKNVVIVAARCANLLQLVRGGGEQGTNYKIAWKNQFVLYIQAVDTILKECMSLTGEHGFYANISYFNHNEINENEDNNILKSIENTPFYVALTNICINEDLDYLIRNQQDERQNDLDSNSIIMKIVKLTTRLKNLLIFIQSMLVDPYPVAKTVKCNLLLDILLRSLSFKCKTSNDKYTVDTLALVSTVPSLHIIVLQTLEAFIICVQGDILPYVTLLMKMIMQNLEETNSKLFNEYVRPYKNVRKAAYSTLNCLFTTVSSLRPSFQDNDFGFEERIISNILNDITYHKPSLQLSVKNVGFLRNMSKKARQKLTMFQLENSNLPQSITNQTDALTFNFEEKVLENIDLTKAALSCLESFFKCSGVFMKMNSHKIIQENLVQQIYDSSGVKKHKDLILKTLNVICRFQSNQQPSILSFCLDSFSRNQCNKNLELKDFYKTNLINNINSIRGCIAPLQFPLAETINFHDWRIPSITSLLNSSRTSENEEIIDLDQYPDNNKDNEKLPIKKRKSIDKAMSHSKKIKNQKDNNVSVQIEVIDSDSENDCTIEEVSKNICEEVNRKVKNLSNNVNTHLSSENINQNSNNILNNYFNYIDNVNEIVKDICTVDPFVNTEVTDKAVDVLESESLFIDETVESLRENNGQLTNKNNIQQDETNDTEKSETQINNSEIVHKNSIQEKNLEIISDRIESVLKNSKIQIDEMLNDFVDEVIDEFK